jgi:asparagine synthase (glutamine-hydrolysing)
LVEFALNLNENLKVKNGVQKYLLKETLFDYVPRALFDRPKWGFSIPLNKWLAGDLKYLIDDHLSKEAIERFGVLNYSYIQSLKVRFFKGEDVLYQRLWLCIQLQIFLKKNA